MDLSQLSWAKLAQIHVKPRRPPPSQIEPVWGNIEPRRSRSKSSRVNLGPSRAEWVKAQVKLAPKPGWVGTEPISSQVVLGPCPVELVWAHVETSQSKPIWSQVDPGHVQLSRLGPMSSRVVAGRFQARLVWVDIGSSQCGVELI